MWRAAGWAETDKRTSSPSVLVMANKSKPLKFNGGHVTERRGVVCGPVCVCGSCGFTSATCCHTQAFSQWDVMVMLIKSRAYLMRDGLGSHWTSGKGIRPISISFEAKECFGWIPLLWSCWPPRILWFHWPELFSASYCLNRDPDFPHSFLCVSLQCLLFSLSSWLCSSFYSICLCISLPSPQGSKLNQNHYWS